MALRAYDLAVRAIEAFNAEDWPALQELFTPDIEVQRAGGMGTLHGSNAVVGFVEPDAFEWHGSSRRASSSSMATGSSSRS